MKRDSAVDSIAVVVADDQELVRSGYRLVCSAAEEIRIVAEAVDGASALAAAIEHRPDVVIMDIRMPGMDGIEATRAIAEQCGPDGPRIVVITTFGDPDYIYDALEAGATSFLLKDAKPEDIVHAVRLAARGGSMLAPEIVDMLVARQVRSDARTVDPRIDTLTPREREVLDQVCKARSNAEIAEQLYVSERTVKGYVSSMMAKLDLRSRVGAVVFAYESGLVGSTEPFDVPTSDS